MYLTLRFGKPMNGESSIYIHNDFEMNKKPSQRALEVAKRNLLLRRSDIFFRQAVGTSVCFFIIAPRSTCLHLTSVHYLHWLHFFCVKTSSSCLRKNIKSYRIILLYKISRPTPLFAPPPSLSL